MPASTVSSRQRRNHGRRVDLTVTRVVENVPVEMRLEPVVGQQLRRLLELHALLVRCRQDHRPAPVVPDVDVLQRRRDRVMVLQREAPDLTRPLAPVGPDRGCVVVCHSGQHKARVAARSPGRQVAALQQERAHPPFLQVIEQRDARDAAADDDDIRLVGQRPTVVLARMAPERSGVGHGGQFSSVNMIRRTWTQPATTS